jgi:hypothetical protein
MKHNTLAFIEGGMSISIFERKEGRPTLTMLNVSQSAAAKKGLQNLVNPFSTQRFVGCRGGLD